MCYQSIISTKGLRRAVAAIASWAMLLFAQSIASAQYTYIKLADSPGNFEMDGTTMVRDSAGNMYGTDNRGIFQYSATTHAVTAYANVDLNPFGLISDANGNMFFGANTGIFEIPAGAQTSQQIATYSSGNVQGSGKLAIDPSGNIFFVSSNSGTNNSGAILEMNAATHAITTIHSFASADGVQPIGGVILDGHGSLYGTTSYGGMYGQGTVYQLNIATQQLTTLQNLLGESQPKSQLTFDSAGNLFGTAYTGSGDGVVFHFPGTTPGNLDPIFYFDADNGANPVGEVLIAPNGDVFGTASTGGPHGHGLVYELIPPPNPFTGGIWLYKDLYDFSGLDGDSPLAGLVMDSAGNLYGNTAGGGANGDGVIFELAAVPEPTCSCGFLVGAIILPRRRGRFARRGE